MVVPVAGAVAVDPAVAVEVEAVGALVGSVEDGRGRLAGDWLARAFQPAAVLRTLPLESPPVGGAEWGINNEDLGSLNTTQAF